MRRTNQQLQPKKSRPGARPDARARSARRHTRLQVEQLESRVVPTTIVLGASKDNTLFESATGLLSNGAGDHFFAGTTNSSEIRRGVIAFDIAGSIPAGAAINSVSLRLNMSRTLIPVPRTISLRTLLADWGEGTSHAIGEEGGGDLATPGDATWAHRFFDTDAWTSLGGDFAATASASVNVGGLGAYTWGSTAQMVADVQAWLDNPASNFGWVLLGNETASASAKRFDTKESPIAANHPQLTIDFTASGFTPISISGQTFNDVNADGVKDKGEAGLADWVVYLDTDGSGTFDKGEPGTTTDAGGNYTFANLGPGTYRVRQVVQGGWQQTTADPADIVAQSGVEVLGQDFGNFQLPSVLIIDDGDPGFFASAGFFAFPGQGFQDDVSFAEPGDGSEFAAWVFTGLAPGVYRVSVTWPPDPNRASDATFFVYDGDSFAGATAVDQQQAPDDLSDQGASWEDLGLFTVTGGVLVVYLPNLGNGFLIADAIRIERVG